MLRLLAALHRGLQQQALTAEDLNEPRARAFLPDRSGCCRPHRNDRPVFRRLLKHLRDQGVIPAHGIAPKARTRSGIARDFQPSWLPQRGLAPTTVAYDLDTVRRFLSARCGVQPLRLEALCPQDVTRFIVPQAHRSSPAHAKLRATALRRFCRFGLPRGVIATDLAQVVPTVPNWRLAALPRVMPGEDVVCLLQSCNRRTPQGQRDYALLLLLARLGLRPGDVVAMTIDALEWETGELLVRGTGGRRDRLPLPQDVGAALGTYLCHVRPRCAPRRVFLRLQAPQRGVANSIALCTIVRRALEQGGSTP
jgi:integrase